MPRRQSAEMPIITITYKHVQKLIEVPDGIFYNDFLREIQESFDTEANFLYYLANGEKFLADDDDDVALALGNNYEFLLMDTKEISLGLKRKLTEFSNDGDDGRMFKKSKKIEVNGAISLSQYSDCFVVDQTKENLPIIQRIKDNEFIRYHAPRASGKSTRMLQLADQLERGIQVNKKYECFYVDFQAVTVDRGVDDFWRTFGEAFPKKHTLPVQITDEVTFYQAFERELDQLDKPKRWNRPVVLLFDEFDNLFGPEASDTRSSCLRALRYIKNNIYDFVIKSIIIIGTFGIMMMNQENLGLSAFNVTKNIGGENFSVNQVNGFFKEYCEDRKIHLDQRIIDDIYSRTSGHAGLVCLCALAIDEDLKGRSGALISFGLWQSFAVTELQRRIMNYPTFEKLIRNLEVPAMGKAVALLQKRFLAIPDHPITITNDEELKQSNLLAKEGVLRVTNGNTFIMASSLLRSLIIKHITFKSLHCPSTPAPLRQDKSFDILNVLKIVVPLFNQTDMQNAVYFSYKSALVKVNNASGQWVPRESVYQQELVGIFQKWLFTFSHEIIGQYHTKSPLGDQKYCNVVLTGPDTLDGNRGPTAILELLATSTKSELKEHYQRALVHAEDLKFLSDQNAKNDPNSRALNIRDIWVAHFTCEDKATKKENCEWPTKEQQPKDIESSFSWQDLNVVVFWHNLDFTEIRMSARWKEYEAMQEVYDEVIFQKSA